MASILLAVGILGVPSGAAIADALDGRVLGGGKPVANSTVTLWSASSGAPQQIAQAQTDADGRFAFNSAGDVWVMNNWQNSDSCFLDRSKDEALSTHCGGNGVTVFFGMAKPVRTPLVGPPRAP